MTYIDAELQRAANEKQFEKDPSAYLFRRNFGTHLFILGLSEAEIQYVVGHDIEGLYETRNEFVNEERLLEIKQKMEQRPIFNAICTIPTIDVEPFFYLFGLTSIVMLHTIFSKFGKELIKLKKIHRFRGRCML